MIGKYLNRYISLCEENKKLFAKVHNVDNLHNSITNMEYIIKETYKSLSQNGVKFNTFVENRNAIYNLLFVKEEKSLLKRIYRKIKSIFNKF